MRLEHLLVHNSILPHVYTVTNMPLNAETSIDYDYENLVCSVVNSLVYSLIPHNFASSLTAPTFSLGAYFFSTLSLWYYFPRQLSNSAYSVGKLTFQNCLLASLPPTLFKILAPPGCSSTNVSILYTLPSMMMYSPFSTVLCSATCFVVRDSDIVSGRRWRVRI